MKRIFTDKELGIGFIIESDLIEPGRMEEVVQKIDFPSKPLAERSRGEMNINRLAPFDFAQGAWEFDFLDNPEAVHWPS